MNGRKLRLGWVIKTLAFALGVALMPALAIVWVCLLVVLAGFGIVSVLAMPVLAVMKADEMITIRLRTIDVLEGRQKLGKPEANL